MVINGLDRMKAGCVEQFLRARYMIVTSCNKVLYSYDAPPDSPADRSPRDLKFISVCGTFETRTMSRLAILYTREKMYALKLKLHALVKKQISLPWVNELLVISKQSACHKTPPFGEKKPQALFIPSGTAALPRLTFL